MHHPFRRRVSLTRSVVVIAVIAAGAPLVRAASDARPVGETAFVAVNVIPMDRERVLEGWTVVVRDGLIAAMGPAGEVPVPAGAEEIDGRGRYLMPGLADMHVHLVAATDLWLFLANGVTTVRNMAGRRTVVAWRDSIARGERPGPTIFTAGPLVDGPTPTWPGSAVVDRAADADSVVAEQREVGYDFIKVYGELSPEAYRAVVGAATDLGLQTAGHIPRGVGVWGALEAGQSSIEHLSGYADAIRPDSTAIDLDMSGLEGAEITARQNEIGAAILAGRVTSDDLIDVGRLDKVARATAGARVYNVPTLWVLARITMSGSALAAAMDEPEWVYLPPPVRGSWPSTASRPDDPSPERESWLRYTAERAVRVVRALRDAGAPILLGSDTPNPFIVPGFSIHRELTKLAEAGLTPYEALRAGTADAAAFLGLAGQFGTVEVGARADLILLAADPLESVSNAREPLGVMARGTWFDRQVLGRRLAEIEREYAGDK